MVKSVSGIIHLVLLFPQGNLSYLEIPTAIVATICLRPRTYLLYPGWHVLGRRLAPRASAPGRVTVIAESTGLTGRGKTACEPEPSQSDFPNIATWKLEAVPSTDSCI